MEAAAIHPHHPAHLRLWFCVFIPPLVISGSVGRRRRTGGGGDLEGDWDDDWFKLDVGGVAGILTVTFTGQVLRDPDLGIYVVKYGTGGNLCNSIQNLANITQSSATQEVALAATNQSYGIYIQHRGSSDDTCVPYKIELRFLLIDSTGRDAAKFCWTTPTSLLMKSIEASNLVSNPCLQSWPLPTSTTPTVISGTVGKNGRDMFRFNAGGTGPSSQQGPSRRLFYRSRG